MSTEEEKNDSGLKEPFSPYVFGIDLGTSNSAIAVWHKTKAGPPEAEIVPVQGNTTCPSVVAVLKGGEKKVGAEARSRIMIDPENTVASIKREMGNAAWTKEFENLPGTVYTPARISGEILDRLVSAVRESDIDVRGNPRFAVICVPANFTDDQKKDTKEAGRLANLDVRWLLEEPCAAALAYACDKDRDQTIMVYDLGGGTFDVAILKVDSSKGGPADFTFLAKEGVPRLGGDDFDREIMKIAAAKVMDSSRVDILDDKKDQGISKRALREAQQRLKEAAERAKCELSDEGAKVSQIEIPNLFKDEEGQVHNLEMELTRDQFNEAIRPLLLQSKDAVQRALDSAKLTVHDISRIILVGGSTRVPLVKEMLTEMLGKEPYRDANPDTIVARGAAIYGGHLEVPADQKALTAEADPGEKPEGTVKIINIVTHFLGIETYGGKFNCLLDKGLEIPAETPLSKTKDFTTPRDDMTELRIAVYQSDREAQFVRDEGVRYVGEFELRGLPAKPRGVVTIDVTFAIDQQNLLKVSAKRRKLEEDKEEPKEEESIEIQR